MLQLTNLTKSFYQAGQEKTVVKDLTLSVSEGEVFGFLGPNGAGKTTTVKLITELIYPDSGTITINSLPNSSQQAKKLYGFMPEQPQFYHHLSAKEVLDYAGQLFGFEESSIKVRTTQLLAKVGLAHVANLAVKKFSKGMHQRLAFAVALINEPMLLIMDEPLDGLDPLGRLDFKKLIIDLKKTGTTIFFSSHILSDVEELCDRIAIIHNGQKLHEGTPKGLIKESGHQTLEAMFVETIRKS